MSLKGNVAVCEAAVRFDTVTTLFHSDLLQTCILASKS